MKGKRRRRLRDQSIQKRLREIADIDPELADELKQEAGRFNKNSVGDIVHSFSRTKRSQRRNSADDTFK